MIWLAAIPAFWVLVIVHTCWAKRRDAAAPPVRPVPYWPAEANPCTWCQVRPEGMCTCTSMCGHVNCVGDHTSLATLTAADMRLLDKWIKEGRE